MNLKETPTLLDLKNTYPAEPAVPENSADLIFPTFHRGYLHEYRLFHYLFKTIPNKISENEIDVEKAKIWFLEKYGHLITQSFFNRINDRKDVLNYDENFIYTLSPDLLVYFDIKERSVRYLFSKTAGTFVSNLVEGMNAFKETEKQEAEIYLLVLNMSFFDIEKFKLKLPEFSIEENYNDDLLPLHNEITSRLNTQNDKGLVLLYGEPGTGKTSYIRYLTHALKKKVIFFPPNLADNITHPNLISILIDNPNAILVIEDAENILLDRNQNDKSAVSALLNLSDGLLSDCLSIQIICTFNTDVTKIDSALLRKGRLIASYKFEALEINKAQKLSDKLGFSSNIAEPMYLTDIYNQSESNYTTKTKSPIGFKPS